MQCVTILYPNKPGSHFNFDYYLQKHVPLWTQYLGGNKIEVRKGIATHNGSPVPFLCIVRVWLDTPIDDFMTKFKNNAHHIISDIPHYTNIEPVIQFDDVLLP